MRTRWNAPRPNNLKSALAITTEFVSQARIWVQYLIEGGVVGKGHSFQTKPQWEGYLDEVSICSHGRRDIAGGVRELSTLGPECGRIWRDFDDGRRVGRGICVSGFGVSLGTYEHRGLWAWYRRARLQHKRCLGLGCFVRSVHE